MSFGYPVMLELAGRRCVVIGEQAIREGKVEGLLAAGADDVLVVEPSLDDRFDGVAGVRVERRAWRPGDLDGAFLAVAPFDTTPRVPRSPGKHGHEVTHQCD